MQLFWCSTQYYSLGVHRKKMSCGWFRAAMGGQDDCNNRRQQYSPDHHHHEVLHTLSAAWVGFKSCWQLYCSCWGVVYIVIMFGVHYTSCVDMTPNLLHLWTSLWYGWTVHVNKVNTLILCVPHWTQPLSLCYPTCAISTLIHFSIV